MVQRVTLGSQVAGILQFVIIMGIALPVFAGCISVSLGNVRCAIPGAFASTYNGLLWQTNQTIYGSILQNTSTQAANGPGSIQSAINNPQYTIGGFLYAGLGSFLINMANSPVMLLNIMSTSFSNFSPFDVAALAIMGSLSTIMAGYILFINAVKMISAIQKVIMEEV